MVLPFALLLLAAQPPTAADPVEDERLRLRVAVNCRIEVGRLVVQRSEEDEQDVPLLVLQGDGPLSDAQLRCYGCALTDTELSPSIESGAIGRRYDRWVDQNMRHVARLVLRDMGLLRHLPRPGRNEPLGNFARRLERYCGAPPGSVLQVENDQVRIAHNGEEPSPPQPTPAWGCAVNAAMVAGHNLLTATPPEPLLQIPTP